MKFSISICMTLGIALAMQTLSASSLNAQDRDQDDRDHERRLRDDVRKEQWRNKFNAEEYIRRQDKNKDGVLAPEEIEGRRTREFLNKIGIPTGKASKVDDLVKAYNKRTANEAESKRKEFRNGLRTLAQFGTEASSFGVEQFGVDDKSEGLQNFDESASGMKASDFDREMLEKADKRLSTFDRDKNGFLDGDEISRISWESPPPEKSDLNRDGRLSKMELAKRFSMEQGTTRRIKSTREHEDSRKRSRGSSSGESFKSDFRSRHGDSNRDRASRDRGSRYENQETPRPTSGTAVAKAKANARSAKGYAKYVDGQFEKYDENSDGKLSKKELSASNLLKKANDSDGDGFISKQEAIALVSGGKSEAPAAADRRENHSPKQSGRRRPVTGASKASNPRAKQRSPLSDKDADADGQIQMHEYSDTWTAEKLEEFRAIDKNGDGLLSPTEWRSKDR